MDRILKTSRNDMARQRCGKKQPAELEPVLMTLQPLRINNCLEVKTHEFYPDRSHTSSKHVGLQIMES